MSKSSNLFNRLVFITEEQSIYALAQETEIPYTTLYNYRKGLRNLPEKYENTLYNAYTRYSYQRMRARGYDVATARLKRYMSPEMLHLHIGTGVEIADLYTFFNVQKKYPNRKLTLKQATETYEWEYYHNRITIAIQQRQKWIEKHPEDEYKYPEER